MQQNFMLRGKKPQSLGPGYNVLLDGSVTWNHTWIVVRFL